MHEQVRAFIEERFPALASQIMAGVRPCVTACPRRQPDDTIPLGGSKFGGRPDVPPDFAWPVNADGPCWFVAQVRLQDLNRFETDVRLPAAGLLSFFYHDAWGPAGTGSRVFLFPGPDLRRIDVLRDPRYSADFHDRHFFARALELRQGYCLPDDIHTFRPDSGRVLPRGEVEDFVEAFEERFPGGIHQFFGHPRQHTPLAGRQLLASFGEVNDRYLYYVPEPGAGPLDLDNVTVEYACT